MLLRSAYLLPLLLVSTIGCASIRPGEISELFRSDEQKNEKPLDNQLALARLCERRGEDEQSKSIYEKILSESPGQPEALHRLGVVCTREGRREDAKRFYAEAEKLLPNSAELKNDRGYLYLLEGEYPAAEQHFRQATELKPSFAAAWTNLGLALGYQDKYDDAFAVFLRATNSPADAHCNLGFVYSQQMKLTEAQTHYRRALLHNPDLKMAAEALLQVSASIPGQEPRTVLQTVATSAPRSESTAEANMRAGEHSGMINAVGSNSQLPMSPVTNMGNP